MPKTDRPDASVAQVAADLGVSTRAVQLWIKGGKVKANRPPGVPTTYPWTIPADEVDRLREQMAAKT